MQRQSSGRVVIVTGAAGGIGTAMTQALLEAGHSVAAVDKSEGALDRLRAAHGAAGERLFPILADVAEEAACRDAVGRALARFGRLDAVINNAGIGVSSLRPDAEVRHPAIEELTAEIWDRFFAVNVRARMLRPQIMGPPARWLLSHEADGFTGQRITAARWDASLPGAQAAAGAGRAIGWPELAADAVWLAEKPG